MWWMLNCVVLLKCKIHNGAGSVVWPLNHFPQLEEVSELWLPLAFLCEGFVHQSDLLPAWISRSEVILFVVLDFRTKKTHSSHLVESFSNLPLILMCPVWWPCASDYFITKVVKSLENKIEPLKDTSLGWNSYPQLPKKIFSISQEAQANVFTMIHLLQWNTFQ